MQKLVLLVSLTVGCGRSPGVVALLERASISVQRNDPSGLAAIEGTVNLLAPHGSARVALGGGHLTGESWGDYVQFLKVSFAPDFDGEVTHAGAHVALFNPSVRNADLAASCGLELNFGVTVVPAGPKGDLDETTFSDRWPLRIDCPPS